MTNCDDFRDRMKINAKAFLFLKAFRHSYGRGDFSYKCQEVKYDETPAMKKLVLMSYLYFITKIIDLMDTVRKFRELRDERC